MSGSRTSPYQASPGVATNSRVSRIASAACSGEPSRRSTASPNTATISP